MNTRKKRLQAGEVVLCDHCDKEVSKSTYYRHKRFEYDQDVTDLESADDLDLSDFSTNEYEMELEDILMMNNLVNNLFI